MKVTVVTNPENGWDCVIGVYSGYTEKELKRHLTQKGYEKDYLEELVFTNMNIENKKI